MATGYGCMITCDCSDCLDGAIDASLEVNKKSPYIFDGEAIEIIKPVNRTAMTSRHSVNLPYFWQQIPQNIDQSFERLV